MGPPSLLAYVLGVVLSRGEASARLVCEQGLFRGAPFRGVPGVEAGALLRQRSLTR